MRARVLFLLALLVGLAFTTEKQAEKTPEVAVEEPSSDASEQPPEAEPEEGKDAPYFTQETLQELAKLDEYKNNQLWACHLLANCKLRSEQVYENLYINIHRKH